MGGRGGSVGASKGGGSSATTSQASNKGGGVGGTSTPEYLQSSEKAVKLTMHVEDHVMDRTITRDVWVPKSQLSADGRPGQWISKQKAEEVYQRPGNHDFTVKFSDKTGRTFSPGHTAQEAERAGARAAAMSAGKSRYETLVAKAKAAGVKGVRTGMKTATIEKKMRDAGVTP